jgi:hypothetical protein
MPKYIGKRVNYYLNSKGKVWRIRRTGHPNEYEFTHPVPYFIPINASRRARAHVRRRR